jgi:transcriptional regulator with XRE-family HTH domain
MADRRELAAFLRAKRERLSPAAAGLPSGKRRRTPGLRREEVAELAGIGTAWYTFLEQGRAVHPSEGALRRIARALQLSDKERTYFFNLAMERAPRKRSHEEVATPPILLLLRQLRCPALLMGQRWDLLAYNDQANAVLNLDYIPDRNMLRALFSVQMRRLFPNWGPMMRQHVAAFRAQNAGSLADPWILEVVDELRESQPEFSEFWEAHEVGELASGHETLDHPFAGRLYWDFVCVVPADRQNQTVRVHQGDRAESCQRLEELHRQWRAGEHTAEHNLWAALAEPVESAARASD